MLDKTLEIARGIAALAVFLFHIRPMVTTGAPWLDGLAAKGSAGVILFFVISGYCMFAAGSATRRHGTTIRNFVKRRLRRIYPPFWASIVAVAVLSFGLEAISALKTGTYSWPSPAWTSFSLSDWALLVSLLRVFASPDGDLQAGFAAMNSVYWTLAIEIQFYFVVAAGLLFGRHWKTVLVVVSALSITPLADSTNGTGLFLPYWPAFAVGLGLGWLHESGRHVDTAFGGRAPTVGAVGFAFALLAFALLDFTSMLAFALASAAILWFAGSFEPLIAKTINEPSHSMGLIRWPLRVALWTGACSYSLYLLHGKIYQLPAMISRQIVDASSLANLLLVVGLTVALCYAFFVLFERPFMSERYRHRLQEQSSRPDSESLIQ